MIRKIIKKDLYKNKMITVSLLIFILLSSLLTASSVSIFAKLSSSLNSFFKQTAVPDFIQMHTGDFSQSEIDQFVLQHKALVNKQQTVKLLNIKGSNIYINQKTANEESSVMDVAFVKQNTYFDFLINSRNEKVHLAPGEIAVPVYYQQRDQLKKNDVLYVNCKGVFKKFKIVDFIKDSQMNSSIISSKRILVSDVDYDKLSSYGQPEYLIEFLSGNVKALEAAYQKCSMPDNGTAITKELLFIVNALMDGIVAAVLFAIALLLMGIAFLCLRFTILMTLQEDVKEIGIMKVIGISRKDIQRLYMGKYTALTMVGCFLGYGCSFLLQSRIFKNIQLYMGTGPNTIWTYILPFFAVSLLGIVILGFCQLILSKLHRITPLQALRSDVVQSRKQKSHYFSLRRYGRIPLSLFVGIQDLWSRKRLYFSVFLVVMLSSFLMIVPYNLQSTMDSKSFIRYMGIGESDLRIDISDNQDVKSKSQEIENALGKDTAVDKFAVYTTYKVDMKNGEGKWKNLQVETGDFTKFPLTYLSGHAPETKEEIAISSSIFKEEKMKLNNTIEIQLQDQVKRLTVCGVYQDITNGGKTAKTKMPLEKITPLRSTINIKFHSENDISNAIKSYKNRFPGIKLTDIKGYVSQTLSGLNKQVHLIVRIAIAIAFFITIFQISLFLKMLLKKDESNNTILKCIGVTKQQIQLQYVWRMLAVALVGIFAGTLTANIGGEYLLSICLQSMGIAHLQFRIIPFMTYFCLPLFLLSGVGLATVSATRIINNLHIADLNIE